MQSELATTEYLLKQSAAGTSQADARPRGRAVLLGVSLSICDLATQTTAQHEVSGGARFVGITLFVLLLRVARGQQEATASINAFNVLHSRRPVANG